MKRTRKDGFEPPKSGRLPEVGSSSRIVLRAATPEFLANYDEIQWTPRQAGDPKKYRKVYR